MLQLPIYQSQTNFNQFSALDFLGQFFNFKPELAWLAVGLLAIFFAVMSFILSYHWKNFGIEKLVMVRAAFIYFLVSGVLLATMFISLAVYLNSI